MHHLTFVRPGSSQQSYVSHLLRVHISSHHALIKRECFQVISKLLSPSVLFEHDPSELTIWLQALPTSIRAETAKGPDGASLLDEKEGVLSLLDEALQRCVKNPYGYVEATLALYGGDSQDMQALDGYSPAVAASPLLMALLEVFEQCFSSQGRQTRIQATPSTILAAATYIRRLIFGIAFKQPDIEYCRRLRRKFDKIVASSEPTNDAYPAMETGIKREVQMAGDYLDMLDIRAKVQAFIELDGDTTVVEDFLSQVEGMLKGDSLCSNWRPIVWLMRPV